MRKTHLRMMLRLVLRNGDGGGHSPERDADEEGQREKSCFRKSGYHAVRCCGCPFNPSNRAAVFGRREKTRQDWYQERGADERRREREADEDSERQEETAELTTQIHQRQDDRDGGQRATEQRNPHGSKRLVGRRGIEIEPAQAGSREALALHEDLFDHHHAVVDQEAEDEYQSGDGQQIEREAGRAQQPEGGRERDADAEQHYGRRAHPAEHKEQHQADEREPEASEQGQFVELLPHRLTAVIRHDDAGVGGSSARSSSRQISTSFAVSIMWLPRARSMVSVITLCPSIRLIERSGAGPSSTPATSARRIGRP